MRAAAAALALGLLLAASAAAQARDDALAEYREGRYERAIEICRGELSSDPGNMNSYAVMCWCLIKLGKYPEALSAAQVAYAVTKYDARIVEVLGETFYYLGRNEDALRYLQQYASMAPEGDRIATAYYLMGESLTRVGSYARADIALSTACYLDKGKAPWWTRLGYAREMAKDYRSAMEAYAAALSLDPSFADAALGKSRLSAAGY